MSTLEILEYPDPRLRTKAKPVTDFGASLQKQIDDMFETMYAAPGIGLAATQVDIHKTLFVIDVSENNDNPLTFINPEIVELRGVEEMEEGCLSFPGIYAKVERADEVTIKALDRNGEPFELDADGLLAVCIQHELDHTQGKLFVDYLSPLKRQRIRKKLEKEHKARNRA
ncbi:peptide deformylase [Aliikangiella coralliicola]|uniref:Peptide deformylase n=1 Tax=Aliikangiella coralliicola TaxID=2592383 RepID=A0A545UGN8_9GAMM|nr:peptide deformylase [Aliikangiella coralliicola]TQV88627.1 peptide deformylase [Aliikangiella coralliicola]